MERKKDKIGAILFDCDGVLIDSIEKKVKAFRQWVTKYYPQWERAFMEYHLASYGVGRINQVKYFINNIVRVPVSEDSLISMLDFLDKCIDNHMETAQLTPGVSDLTSICANKGIKMFVVSGAPRAELDFHLTRLGIFEKFNGIFGSPISKEEGVRQILGSQKMVPENLIFVGDATADANAAFSFGIRFVYYPSEAKMESVHVWKKIKNMKDLIPYV